jgi:hypothetical protein
MKKIISKPEYLVIALTILTSIGAAVYFFDVANANGDSIARLNIARRVVDSTSPGFAQLGYVWLPISSILMLPFIWLDSLYYSGFAGIIISMLSFIGAVYFLFEIGSMLAGRTAGVFAALLFGFNPNTLYMQSTSLTEMFYIFAILGGVLWALKWGRDHKDRYLAASGLFFLLATLSRYDGWFLVAAAMGAVALYELIINRDWRRVEGTVIMFGFMAFFGIFLWITWNFVIFGDALYFLHGPYSAQFQQADLLKNNLLPSFHDMGNAFMHTFWSAEMTLGWGLLVVGALGVVYMLWEIFVNRKLRYLFVVILGAQVFYYIINLYGGNGVIFVPQLYPGKMHNIRYAMTFLPLFAIAGAVITSRVRFAGAALVAIVLAEYIAMGASGHIITLNESVSGFAGRDAHASRIAAGDWLRTHYDHGAVLADVFDNDVVAFESRIPGRTWVNVGDPDLYGRALKSPEDVVSWVVIRKNDAMAERFHDGAYLENNFSCVYQQDDITIYKHKDVLPSAVSECGVKHHDASSVAFHTSGK